VPAGYFTPALVEVVEVVGKASVKEVSANGIVNPPLVEIDQIRMTGNPCIIAIR
jgi:hypothetical protein